MGTIKEVVIGGIELYWKFHALVYYQLIIQLIVQYKDTRGLSIYSFLRSGTGIFICHQYTSHVWKQIEALTC